LNWVIRITIDGVVTDFTNGVSREKEAISYCVVSYRAGCRAGVVEVVITVIAETDETNNTPFMTINNILDQEPPQLVATNPAGNGYVQQLAELVFTLADLQNSVDDQAVIAGFRLTDANETVIAGTTTENLDHFTFTPTSQLSDGSYTATIVAVDNLGNSNLYSYSFTVDSIPPVKPNITGGTVASGLIQERPYSNRVHEFEITLTGDREPFTAVIINGVQQVAMEIITAWAIDLPLDAGMNVLAVQVRDRAGNFSPTALVEMRVESEDPVLIEYDSGGRIELILRP